MMLSTGCPNTYAPYSPTLLHSPPHRLGHLQRINEALRRITLFTRTGNLRIIKLLYSCSTPKICLLENLSDSTSGASASASSTLFRLSNSASRAKSAAVFFALVNGFPRPLGLFLISLHFLVLLPSAASSVLLR